MDTILKQHLDSASPEIRKFILETGWKPVLEVLSTDNRLTDEQKNVLENEIIFVLLGLDLQTNLARNIQEQLGVSDAVASLISSVVKLKIFKPFEPYLPREVEDATQGGEEVLNVSEASPSARQNLISEIEHPKPAPEKIVPAPQTNELKLEAPKLEESAVSLAPANLPTVEPAKPASLIDNKIKNVVATPPIKSAYPNGADPYREPLQ